jgi:hypothetical protein
MFACFQPNIWLGSTRFDHQHTRDFMLETQKTGLGGGRCVLSLFSALKHRSAIRLQCPHKARERTHGGVKTKRPSVTHIMMRAASRWKGRDWSFRSLP